MRAATAIFVTVILVAIINLLNGESFIVVAGMIFITSCSTVVTMAREIETYHCLIRSLLATLVLAVVLYSCLSKHICFIIIIVNIAGNALMTLQKREM